MSGKSNINTTIIAVGVASVTIAAYLLYSYSTKKNKAAKYDVVFVLGGPGAGKVNQQKFIE